jgi:uncharacterized protein YpmS
MVTKLTNYQKIFFLLLALLLILIPVVALGLTGLVPGLSTLFRTNKPRDLGIKYTQEDLRSARSKSQIDYLTLPDNPNSSATRQFQGSRNVTSEFTAAEITATLNNRPWKHWPYKNVQIKFNADGSGEISGVLVKNKIPGYAFAIGIPEQATTFAMKYLPTDPVFYVKMKASLENNKVVIFEPEKLEIGRIPLPVKEFLAGHKIISSVHAVDFGEMTQELSKVDNKKALIISYINSRLSSAFGSFYAKRAYFAENKLVFDGTLPEKNSYTP